MLPHAILLHILKIILGTNKFLVTCSILPWGGGGGGLPTSSTCWTGTTNQLFKEHIAVMQSDSCKEKTAQIAKNYIL
jgi:hypothetical protein